MIIGNLSNFKIMKTKVLVFIFLFNMFLLIRAKNSADKNENLTIIPETSSNQTAKQIVGGKPIMIHTQLQHYDKPTLREYQECHENLAKCKRVCEGVEKSAECVKECPVCPFLVKEKIVVQGINDTDFTPAVAAPLNTTNVIRLTNQIRNIIETHQGRVIYRNENIVHVHQNISRVGGKFGLGYNNTDPCCIAIRSSKHCDMLQFSIATRCHHKRHRVCGKQCKSRVMLARRITLCEKPVPYLSNEDYSEKHCYETVKYIPYKSPKKQYVRSRNKCTPIPSWPYILCGQYGKNYEQSICTHCLGLTYYYVLQRGIPVQCNRCFRIYSGPYIEMHPQAWYPITRPNNDLFDNNFDSSIDDWQLDKTKCILPNGAISENCHDFESHGSDSTLTTSDIWENLPETQDEYDYYEDNGVFDFEENSRKRRHTFNRSKYSRRYA